MIRVFMIRHGQSESNAGSPSGDPISIPLTVLGHRQAEQVSRMFAEDPALIVTSPHRRARQSAQPTIDRFRRAACQEWPVQEFTYLGDLHGQIMTAQERRPFAQAFWNRCDPNHANAGAESFSDLLHRVRDFLDRLGTQKSGPVTVFTHGLFMRAVAWSVLTGVTAPGREEMRSFRSFADHYLIPNCGVAELRLIGDGAPRLLGASTMHLPADLAQHAQ